MGLAAGGAGHSEVNPSLSSYFYHRAWLQVADKYANVLRTMADSHRSRVGALAGNNHAMKAMA